MAAERSLTIAIRKPLDDFELTVETAIVLNGITAIYGHSGSGKTSLLRCLAGLDQADGKIQFDQESWLDENVNKPSYERQIGYVFQGSQLFPHLNVRENINYAYQRSPKGNPKLEPSALSEWLGLNSLLDRRIDKLSGGEQQRVAIARALASHPRLLLMDEPLSALDRKAKKFILPYLSLLNKEFDIPVIYVSHSMQEVAQISDRILILEKGKLIAHGELSDVLAQPELSIQDDKDAGVVVQATITEKDAPWQMSKAEFSGGSIWIKDQGESIGESVRLRLLARDISLSLSPHEDQSIVNAVPVIIDQIFEEAHPALRHVRVIAKDTPILARLTARSVHQLNLQPGDKAWAQIKSVAVIE